MKTYSLLILIILMTSGCVSKTKYENLLAENEKLKTELEQLKLEKHHVDSINNQFLIDKKKQEEEKKLIKWHSEEEANKALQDYYSFVYKSHNGRNPKYERLSNNQFKVSLEETDNRLKSAGNANPFNFELEWYPIIYKITINENGTYLINRMFQ